MKSFLGNFIEHLAIFSGHTGHRHCPLVSLSIQRSKCTQIMFQRKKKRISNFFKCVFVYASLSSVFHKGLTICCGKNAVLETEDFFCVKVYHGGR